ncbi:MAG: rhodanese-like domain-containing protein [Bacteroidetes bacterium]|nr:rhodanese-like domain-containing protein [Bacteroidota bacterium]
MNKKRGIITQNRKLKGQHFFFCSCFYCLFLFFYSYTSTYQVTTTKTLSPTQFKYELKKQHGVLIDVRTSEEYNAECIAGAININMQATDFKARVETLDKNKTYFLYCLAGKRSLMAMHIMAQQGFKKVYDLKGGITEWKKKEFPVIKPKLQKNQQYSITHKPS